MDFLIDFTRKQDGLLVAEGRERSVWFSSDSFANKRGKNMMDDIEHATRSFHPEVDLDQPFLKLCLIVAPDKIKLATDAVTHLESLDYAYAGYEDYDLTAKGVNKGKALKTYAEYAGIPREQIAAFGDQLNDVAMLNYAGLPIAMENAQQIVKDAAQWVMPTNDEDGVAQGMERILAEQSNQ
jgi:HAD superfamily hydrolase (TIGR01484 family)